MGEGLTDRGEGGRISILGTIFKASLKKAAYKVDGRFKCGNRMAAEEELHIRRDLLSELLACPQNL